MLNTFFQKENISSFALLPFSACRVTNEAKFSRLFDTKKPAAVCVFLIPYRTKEETGRNISHYAVSRDYHLYLKELGERAKNLPHFLLASADTTPIDEIDLALKAGLGVRGKNGLLISSEWGSYVFIGCLFFSEPVGVCQAPQEVRGCLHCGACLSSCPTRALSRASSPCLSALSQQKRINEEEQALLKEHGSVWGCDVCQDVCPMNRAKALSPIPFFHEERVGHLDRERVLHMVEDGTFSRRAYAWRGEEVVLRNLALQEESEL